MVPKIEIKGLFFIYLAFSILFIPFKWIASWLFAVTFHELCHILALRCFRCEMKHISIGFSGAVISSAPVSGVAALICEVAGPVGSFMLLIFSRLLPTVAVCGFIQGIFNLLPLHPLDGSKVLDHLLSLCLPDKYKKSTVKIIQILVITLLLIGSLFLYRISFGPVPLIIVLILIWNSRKNSLQKGI